LAIQLVGPVFKAERTGNLSSGPTKNFGNPARPAKNATLSFNEFPAHHFVQQKPFPVSL